MPELEKDADHGRRKLRGVIWVGQLLALGLVVVSARLWLIERYATSLPILDQWDGEAAAVLKPWQEGRLSIADLFRPHNEHRIVLSRALMLGLTWLNGQWDPQLQMTVHAFGCALFAVAAAIAASRILNRRWRGLIIATVAAWWVLPYGYQNTLWGFQSCFYFLLFFSLLAIWGLVLHSPGSLGWNLGAGGAVGACLSMASGLLCAAAVLLVVAMRLPRRRRFCSSDFVTAGFCVGIIAVTAYFQVPGRDSNTAHAFSHWLAVFGRCLAWPFLNLPAASLLMYAPLALLISRHVRESGRQLSSRSREVLIAAGCWSALQAAAIAYARAGEGHIPPSSRHMDLLALGAWVNALACLCLLNARSWASRRQRLSFAGALIWMLVVLCGSVSLSRSMLGAQHGRVPHLQRAEQNLRGFVATGDRSYIQSDPPRALPHPNAARLINLLNDPAIRRILPASIRPPLRVLPEEGGRSFIRQGLPAGFQNPPFEQAWGSFTGEREGERGTMTSQPLASRFPYLQFEIASKLRPTLALALRGSGGEEQRVRIGEKTRGPWRHGFVKLPDREARIVARDEDPAGWFAFREPRELGRLSYVAEWLVRRSERGVVASLCLFAALLLLTGVNWVRLGRDRG